MSSSKNKIDKSDCSHCYHEIGSTTSRNNMGISGGTIYMRCCFCGDVRIRRWTAVEVPVEGHGPLHTAIRKRFDDET